MTQAAQQAMDVFKCIGAPDFSLADFLMKVAELIQTRDAYTVTEKFEKESQLKHPFCWSFRNTGRLGAVTITVNPAQQHLHVSYRSGAEKYSDCVNYFRVGQDENFLTIMAKRAATANVWHRGAVVMAEELLATVPTNAFRHEVIRRPSYEKAYPFCDFVLREFPDVCMLRVAHDGFSLWQGKKFQQVEKWSDIDTRPITEVVEGEVQSMWRLGTGILFTSGQFERTENGIKFVPSKRG